MSSAIISQIEQETSSVGGDSLVDIELDANPTTIIIQQKPVSVTLDGQTILGLALSLLLILHFVEVHFAELLILFTPILLFVWTDYQNFLGLGPGGTPSTFQGYVRIAWLRLWALRDPFTAPKADQNRLPKSGLLARNSLPYRTGPRPIVAGIAPQRQVNQQGSPRQYRALRRILENTSVTDPKKFGVACSCFEKHGLALFARHPVNTTCQGEICHVHDSDHSLHLCLHPDDIREVLERGWGQRHPLARKCWFGAMPVPETFMMIYAPRG
jgi:hypothetical protein